MSKYSEHMQKYRAKKYERQLAAQDALISKFKKKFSGKYITLERYYTLVNSLYYVQFFISNEKIYWMSKSDRTKNWTSSCHEIHALDPPEHTFMSLGPFTLNLQNLFKTNNLEKALYGATNIQIFNSIDEYRLFCELNFTEDIPDLRNIFPDLKIKEK